MFMDLESQMVSNYCTITKKYGVVNGILMREYEAKMISNYKVTTE